MKTELLIANKRSGKIWECSNCVTTCSWETNRTGSPGKFTFTLIKAGDIDFLEGDIVRFKVDGQLQFYGWVFTKNKDRWGIIDVTCYDRLRYFKANASYAFYDQTAADIIRQIAGDLQIDTGNLMTPPYAIPSLIEEDQSCLDIVNSAVEQTLLNTGDIYVFFDDGNGVALQRPEDMISNIIIGEKSLLLDYAYKTDIDTQTYNYVKLCRPNEETGRTDVFIAEDSANIAQWGMLQLYQSIDGDVNDAQAQQQALETLSYYNRRLRTLKIESLGVPGLRAGQLVYMIVPALGDIALNQYVLLEQVTHTWENNVHTMEFATLEL